MILAIRTDKPEAELYLYNKSEQLLDTYAWHAHRQLSNTLTTKIEEFLLKNRLNLSGLSGIIAYEGPGSFTGLRIGITIANTLAYSLNVPIVGASGDLWLSTGLEFIQAQSEPQIIIPKYGSEAYITPPRK